MDLSKKVMVVTGGASGLGAALCRRYAEEGARVAVVDLDEAKCQVVADAIGGVAVGADVGDEAQVVAAVAAVEGSLGPIDVWHSNAGVSCGRDVFSGDDEWLSSWQVNVMASVYAARALLPGMLDRKSGYLVGTASGAALTAEPGVHAYSVTKHAMLDFYEVLAIRYASHGIKVSCFCPFGMLTPMLLGAATGVEDLPPEVQVGMRGAVSPEHAAGVVAQGLHEERFLILSHPEALTYFQRKSSDYDRWLSGMRRIYA